MSDDKVSAERVLELLGGVKYPGFPRDVVTLGMVAGVDFSSDAVRVQLRLPGGRAVPRELHAEITSALAPLGRRVEVEAVGAPVQPESSPRPASASEDLLPEVRAVLAVSSAKGGVGKSTVASMGFNGRTAVTKSSLKSSGQRRIVSCREY